MAYELKEIEWKISSKQLNKKLLLFSDNQSSEIKNLCFFSGSKYKMEQSFKAATYKIITKEFQNYFAEELFRIRTSIANHRIEDPVNKFSRYINTNYKGLLKLQKNGKYDKPLKVNFNSPSFRHMYEKVTLHQIHYDLQNIFVAPLIKTFEEEYQAEIMPSPYVHSISQQKIKEQQSTPKLKWNGKVNQLVTFFYDLSNDVVIDGEPALSASQNEIAEFIVNNFVDKNDNVLSLATVKTILSPGKADKRSPEHKKYQILKK